MQFSCNLFSVADVEGVIKRERMAGIYRLSAYFLAVCSTEIPIVVIIVTMFVVVTYWMAMLMPAALNFFAHWFTHLLYAFASQVVLETTMASGINIYSIFKYPK